MSPFVFLLKLHNTVFLATVGHWEAETLHMFFNQVLGGVGLNKSNTVCLCFKVLVNLRYSE